MAVIVKYVVVRDGDEKMTFATKKEADAHDKMLDIAENLYQFLKTEEIEINEDQMDELSLCLAKNKDVLLQLLKGGKLPQQSQSTATKKVTNPTSLKKMGKKETKPTDPAVESNEESRVKKTKAKAKAGKQKKIA